MNPIASQLLSPPIVLRGTATLPLVGGTSAPVTFDTTKLQNTLRVPIEITEFVFTSRVAVWLDGTLVTNAHPGAGVDLDLRVGGLHMTNGFVPFSTLAPWNWTEDDVWASTFLSDVPAHETLIGFSHRRVVLPEPLRLRPGVGFSGSVRRNIPALTVGVPTAAETISFSAIGRVVPQGIARPVVQAVPLWSSWIADKDAAATKVVASGERDLLNPLSVPLEVTRMITASHAYNTTELYSHITGAQVDPAMTLRWPNGDLLNESPVYLQSAFIREHALSEKFALPPGSRVNVTLDYTGTAGEWNTARTNIALFGTRREVL